jgi:hypothetical protein
MIMRSARGAVGPGVVGRRVAALGVAVLVGAGLVACTTAAGGAGHGGGGAGAPAVGVLGGSCDADRAAALRGAGVRLVELGAEWSRFEPAPGRVDRAYVDELRARVARCADAGLDVVLTPGLHRAPAWVVALPDGAYRDQYGNTNPAAVPNFVFSATVRDAAARYLDRFAAEIPLDGFAAIRVGTSEAGELGYPSRELGTGGNSFWAFDDAALTGDGLAAGSTPNPLPGWVPGARAVDGRPVTDAEVGAWFDWYADAAARTAVWGIDLLRARGYAGPVHLPLAGRGVLPADLRAATAAALDGTADRDGSLERGLYYPRQLPAIAAATRGDPGGVVADATGVGDATAVAARRRDPPQDSCRPGDTALLADAPVDTWSATRWTVATARAAGLRVVGENPGDPATPGTGGDASSDGPAGQLVHAPRYARECGLEALLWAFEDDLFAPGAEVSVDDLGRAAAGRPS